MTLTVNGIDLAQPPQGVATTAGIRTNFTAIDTALNSINAALSAGVSLAPILSAISAIPAGANGTLQKTGSASVSVYTVSAFAQNLLGSADATSFQTALGLGTAATLPSSAFATANHTHNAFALPLFAGDTGSGGQQGLVPAPAAGTAANSFYLRADGTWAGLKGALVGNLSGGNFTVSQINLKNYTEQYATKGTVNGSVSLAFTDGTYQYAVLNGNTTFTITGLPAQGLAAAAMIVAFKQDATGGRSATFSGVRWGGGTPPSISAAANSISIISFVCGIDGTNTVYGFVGGLAFA